MTQTVFTVQEIAAILKVSTKTVYTLVREQELEHIRVRGQIRVTALALQKYLKGAS